MKKVVSIAGIDLDYSLFISTEFEKDNYTGSSSLTIDGSSVLFIQEKGSLTKEVQVYSGEHGWVHEDTKDLLSDSVGVDAITIVFNDASEETYYYDHTQTPIIFTPLYEGSEYYTVEINLLKG